MTAMLSVAAGIDCTPGGSATMRLAEFCRVATTSVDEAAEQIGRIFCPHRLQPAVRTAQHFCAVHNCAPFDGFSINYVAYGSVVTIDPGYLERFFLIQLPLSGTARIHAGSREVASCPGLAASLLSPTVPTRMLWEDCEQLILLVDRRVLEQRAAALSGKAVQPVVFDPSIDVSKGAGSMLAARMHELAGLAERIGPDRELSAVAAADRREALLELLLIHRSHDLSDAIRRFSGRSEALPRGLQRARDFLHAHAAEPLDLVRLAEIAGIGIRALQCGFRRHFGSSISEMLQDLRLAQLNARLMNAPPEAHIIDIAFDLGFSHLGRMAGAYKAKFGETPSATRRRACGPAMPSRAFTN
ncbi:MULTISPECIES: AraC family transcriptional regulator [unclassified Bradyrhizobium]|uniref:AraC family transcriptional regulator n=1 Tax=unclassified Bradyrhizobium TaxID=2631580 RepID=UPI0029169ADA|nr:MULTISPECIES: AraC family transcriptional regulator [unclassified Bradyrhizobium]